jgi:5'-phosphate synthase pdxT subunit
MTIGVVAYQGDFARHAAHLSQLGVGQREVRTVTDLAACDGLVIPGGESTTIGMLLDRFGLLEVLCREVRSGFPVFGTCAGAILLAETIEGSDQPRIGGISMEVRRNAYGRQIASFEAEVLICEPLDQVRSEAKTTMHGVFIRAPRITRVGTGVTELLRFENEPVCVRQQNLLAATFHPELTPDLRLHRYFTEQIVAKA